MENVYKNAHNKQAQHKRVLSVIKYIDGLSEQEKCERLEKSLHNKNIDHKKRGENISKSKRGISTNQQQITGTRLAQTSEDNFQSYLNTIIAVKFFSVL